MKNRTTLAAIDVGTTKICTLVGELDGSGHVQVTGVGINPSNGMHKGMVVNISDAKASILESVRQAENVSNRKIESAYVGVTGRHIATQNYKSMVSITRDDHTVHTEDLKRVLSGQSVKVTSDRKLLHVIPRSYLVDGQEITSPIGMHGQRLDVETHVVTGAVTSIQNLMKCIHGVGIEIDDLVLEPLASAEAMLTPEEKQVGVILAEIGGGTTDIAVFRNGAIWHAAVLPVAGYQLTRDIAIGLGVPFDVAEEMKKKYGSVESSRGRKLETPDTISKDGHGVSYQDLSDIIRARVEEILKLILLELPRTGYEQIVPAGLVFSGGSSNLGGLADLGQEIFRIPVRVGMPSGLSGFDDVLQDPAYATAIGLLLWGSKYRSTRAWRSGNWFSSLWNIVWRLRKLFGRSSNS